MKPLTPEQQEMVAKNLGLATYFAKPWFRYARDVHEQRDMIGAAYIGLCGATTKYQPAKGKFSPYVRRWCDHYIRRYLAERMIISTPNYLGLKRNANHEFQKFAVRTGRVDVLPEDLTASEPELDGEEIDAWRQIFVNTKILTNRERFILEQRMQGKTQVEIGRETGVTRQAVEIAGRRAIKKLRTAYS